MKNEHEGQNIDWDQVLRDIQDENEDRLAEILNETASQETVQKSIANGVKFPRVIELFIPPGAR